MFISRNLVWSVIWIKTITRSRKRRRRRIEGLGGNSQTMAADTHSTQGARTGTGSCWLKEYEMRAH